MDQIFKLIIYTYIYSQQSNPKQVTEKSLIWNFFHYKETLLFFFL